MRHRFYKIIVLTVVIYFISFVLLWANQIVITPTSALIGQLMERVIATGFRVSNNLTAYNARIPYVAGGLLAAAAVLLAVGRRWSIPWITISVAGALMAQHLVIKEEYLYGTGMLVIVIALLAWRRWSVGVPILAKPEPEFPIWLISLPLLVIPLLYRLDSFLQDQALWSPPTLYTLIEFISGRLAVIPNTIIWQQGRETTSQESLIWVGLALPCMKLFGVKLLTLRWISTLSGISTLVFWGILVHRHLGKWLAFLAVVVLGLTPIFLAYGRTETYVGFTTFWPTLAVLFLWGALY